MSKSNKTSNWVKKHSQDPFVKKSIQERYRSRAAYKLKEIDDKYRNIKPGKLGDLAPTILTMMGVNVPSDMTGDIIVDVAVTV